MTDATELLDALREAVENRTEPAPALRDALLRSDDALLLQRAGRILAGLRPEDHRLRPVRTGILASCTIGPYHQLLQAALVAVGALPIVESGAYGTFEMSLATAASGEDGAPDVVTCLLDESYFLPGDWGAADVGELAEHLETRLADLRELVLGSVRRSPATLVLHTIPLPGQVRDGVISWRARAALARSWHRLNAGLLGLAEESDNIAVVDLVGVLADAAVQVRDDRLHRYGDMPYTGAALLLLAREVARFVQAKLGLSRKVLALDLDDTLWGGVLGEVGAEGVQLGGLYPGNCYQELQRTVVRLREQGVILALASKNDAPLVERALSDHPEVLLRPDAFSATAVNWSPKAGNLRAMASSLALSTGSFVFMDDSSFERGHIGAELPEVAIVATDGDPAHLVRSLLRHGWFDAVELTGTDRRRPELYRTRALRTEFSSGFGSSEDYLRALEVEVTAAPVDGFTTPRAAQLAARTNQFNLTGVRFDEATTTAVAADPEGLAAVFGVRDRFGDEGIVGAVWVECGQDTWRVSNLVLSCRVLGRGVELAIAAWIAASARKAGAGVLEGRFVASGRNDVARDFWEKAGFTRVDDEVFRLDLESGPVGAPDWIKMIEEG